MTLTAVLLISFSAFAHAFWNLLGKRNSPSGAFFLTASLASLICLSPVVLIYLRAVAHIPAQVWLLLGAAGIFQAIYMVGLAGAYRHGDMSLAYPLLRALPVILVAALTVALRLGKAIPPLGYVGMFTVVIGCLLVPQPGFRHIRLRSYLNLCCALALLAACGTAGYTLVDSEALRILRSLPQMGISQVEIAILFMELETAAIVLMLGIYILLTASERKRLPQLLREGWRPATVTGLIITCTYGLVLIAMAFVSNVSYLAAFRQLSIPIGALFGVLIQKEPAPPPKVVGILILLSGLVMVALA